MNRKITYIKTIIFLSIFSFAFVGCSNTSVKHTITWQDWDGSVLEIDKVNNGDIPTYNGQEPTRVSTPEYSYSFSGWTPEVKKATSDETYVATYSRTINEYTITWKNWDGTTLKTESVQYGSLPNYNGQEPTREKTKAYSYKFTGWTPEIEEVTQDATYVAQYESFLNKYTVTWTNWDGTILEVDSNVNYGETPHYDGTTPSRDRDTQYTYTFKSWSPSISFVESDITYTACFETTINQYTITWKNWDGTILKTEEVNYGETPSYGDAEPSRNQDNYYSYSFKGWSPSIESVTGNATYIAQYYNSPISYSISYNLDGGTADNPTSYSIESGDFVLSYPTKNGYEFLGWTGSNGDSPQKDVAVECDGGQNYQFTANWKLVTYSITYYLFDGTNNDENPSNYTINDSFAFKQPSKTGYSFVGWYTESSFENKITGLNNNYGNLELYAKFEPNKYLAIFDDLSSFYFNIHYIVTNDDSLNNVLLVKGDGGFLLYDYVPSKAGYVFDGWYSDTSFTEFINSDFTIDDDVYVYGRMIDKKTIRDVDFGILTEQEILLASGFIVNELREKMFFYIPKYADTSSVYVYAMVKAECRKNGKYYDQSYADATTPWLHLVANPTTDPQNNYVYKTNRIAVSPEICKIYQISIYVRNDSYGVAQAGVRVEKCPTIKVMVTISNSIEQTYGSTVHRPYVAQKNGYIFDGWFDDNNVIISDVWEYNSDQTFHSKWTKIVYNITYIMNGGINDPENPSTYTVEDIITLKDPIKEGYYFDHWWMEGPRADTGKRIKTINGAECRDLKIYAYFSDVPIQ